MIPKWKWHAFEFGQMLGHNSTFWNLNKIVVAPTVGFRGCRIAVSLVQAENPF